MRADSKPLRIGIAGLGTVAGGVVALLRNNADALARRAGRPLSLVRVASRSPKPEVDLNGAAFTTDLNALHEPDIDVVVELIGGEDRAAELMRRALQGRQAVVTANKAVLARHGGELLGLAQTQGVALGFEAAVAGGIPVIGALTRGLAANRVQMVAGIINGTSNYILTAMSQHGASFQAALSQAQAQGFAEADPTYDVEGTDAAHKLAILAALAFDMDFRFAAVYTEGISGITKEDLGYAEELGYRLKHLAIARQGRGRRGSPRTPHSGAGKQFAGRRLRGDERRLDRWRRNWPNPLLWRRRRRHAHRIGGGGRPDRHRSRRCPSLLHGCQAAGRAAD